MPWLRTDAADPQGRVTLGLPESGLLWMERTRPQHPRMVGIAGRSFLLCWLSPCWSAQRVTAALIASGAQTEHKACVSAGNCDRYYRPDRRLGSYKWLPTSFTMHLRTPMSASINDH